MYWYAMHKLEVFLRMTTAATEDLLWPYIWFLELYTFMGDKITQYFNNIFYEFVFFILTLKNVE